MEEARGELQGSGLRLSSLRPSTDSSKSPLSGRYPSRNSPSLRRLHSGRTSRREARGVGGAGRYHQWFRGNRVLFLLVLITLWAYIGFAVQSQWAHGEHSKTWLFRHRNTTRSAEEVGELKGTATSNSTLVDPVLLGGDGGSEVKRGGGSLTRKGRRVSSSKNSGAKKSSKRLKLERKLESSARLSPKISLVVNRTLNLDNGNSRIGTSVGNKTVDMPEGIVRKNTSHENQTANFEEIIPRRNMSYGLLVGPFSKMEDSILDWSPEKRRGTCDRKGPFARLVWSRRFVLVIHELSMGAAPLTMMELATEILSCGGTVSVVALSRKGGLMEELDRRGIKVLEDKGEQSCKTAMKADLIIAGSSFCSSWIEQYFKHFTTGSSQILWWIMENHREHFDRSKHMLNQVKKLAFLSEPQSKQWFRWCEEEKIELKAPFSLVPPSINDELAFAAGISCSLNTPLYSVEKMQEKKNFLRLAVRKELGLSENDMLVMSLNSISPGKGQLLLLKSALLVVEQQVPLVNFKILEKNLSQWILPEEDNVNNELPNNVVQRNATKISIKQKKRRHSRSLKRPSTRNLLSDGEEKDNRALKMLMGSFGSKSNKMPYIKSMLGFLTQHSNLSKSLLWTPSTTRVSGLYMAADVYVNNAQGFGETFGRGTIEAMAFGLPVLGTDAGSTKEIVEDKITGLLHPVGQEGTQLLAEHLHFLLSNQSAREQLGRNGRIKVEQMYLKRHLYRKLAHVFTHCMKIK